MVAVGLPFLIKRQCANKWEKHSDRQLPEGLSNLLATVGELAAPFLLTWRTSVVNKDTTNMQFKREEESWDVKWHSYWNVSWKHQN